MNDPATYRGALLAESLRLDAVVEAGHLTVTKISRAAVGDIDAGQPREWTFIEFSVPAGSVDALANALSRAIDAEGAWYCDFHSDSEVVVVFCNRVFRYPTGDRDGRSAAENYARLVGVPEAQIDWPE